MYMAFPRRNQCYTRKLFFVEIDAIPLEYMCEFSGRWAAGVALFAIPRVQTRIQRNYRAEVSLKAQLQYKIHQAFINDLDNTEINVRRTASNTEYN